MSPSLSLRHSARNILSSFSNLNATNMSLWTPYADLALDLTKPTVTQVKRECVSPRVPSPGYPCLQYGPSYGFAHAVPSPQYSPDSASSAWSSPSLYAPASAAPSPPYTLDGADLALEDDMEYQAFERDALQALAERNGGSLLGSNPRMRRAVQAGPAADAGYRQQRQRNNQAAKQSRDRRKLREVRLAFQVTFLKKKLAETRALLATGACARCRRPCLC